MQSQSKRANRLATVAIFQARPFPSLHQAASCASTLRPIFIQIKEYTRLFPPTPPHTIDLMHNMSLRFPFTGIVFRQAAVSPHTKLVQGIHTG